MSAHINPASSPAAAPGKSLAELRGLGKIVAKDAGGSNVQAFFEANKGTLKAVLPSHANPERMLKLALGALRTTPKLMQCTLESLFGAVVTCSQLGLEPNTPQGHIYLIPFENKRAGKTEVQVVVGYKGLVDLARRSGQIVSISARTVHLRDEFALEYGTEDKIVHRPFMEGDRGPLIGVYAVAKLQGGGVQFEFMTRAEIERVRDNSQGWKTALRFNATDRTPWGSNFEEMAKKTAIRRLSKYLPSSIEMAAAVRLDEKAEAGHGQDMSRVLDGADYSEVAASSVVEAEAVEIVDAAEIAEREPGEGE